MHAIKQGLVSEIGEDSFYTGKVGKCYHAKDEFQIVGYGRVNTKNPEALKAAIRHSPVTAVIDSEVIHFLTRVSVSDNFIVDSKQIGCNPLGSKTGAVVLLVGYEKDTFIVKGSWGADLG